VSDVKPEFLTPEGYLVETMSALGMTGGGITVFKKSALIAALWAYGEDGVLDTVESGLSKTQVDAIGVRHRTLTYTADPAKKSGNGYPFDKALALAAVELLDGNRDLARKRRRPSS
jgi:hypothetical protein